MFNKIILLGNLTRDMEVRYSQNGLAIAKSGLAVNRKFKSAQGEQKEEVCFIDVVFFGRSAEIANQYLKRGSKILVEGRLVFEQWSDQNGNKRSKHTVNVENMQMIDTKPAQGVTQTQQAETMGVSQQNTMKPQENPTQGAIPEYLDDDNPF